MKQFVIAVVTIVTSAILIQFSDVRLGCLAGVLGSLLLVYSLYTGKHTED